MILLLCTLLLGGGLSGVSMATEVRYDSVTAKDGVPLIVAESGDESAPAVLLIHGYSQGIVSWQRQLRDRILSKRFRLVAMELRGHGASGKPWREDAYQNRDWADDVASVIEAKALSDVVLVGWSFGGSVICAYLRHHGERHIGGVVFAAGAQSFQTDQAPVREAVEKLSAAEREAALERSRQMLSDNVEENLEGTGSFVDRLVHGRLTPGVRQELLALNMLTPAYVRRAIVKKLPTYEDLVGNITLPMLFIHGAEDGIIPAAYSETGHRLFPASELIVYEDVGHSPFLEAPEKFNQDLMAFVARLSDSR